MNIYEYIRSYAYRPYIHNYIYTYDMNIPMDTMDSAFAFAASKNPSEWSPQTQNSLEAAAARGKTWWRSGASKRTPTTASPPCAPAGAGAAWRPTRCRLLIGTLIGLIDDMAYIEYIEYIVYDSMMYVISKYRNRWIITYNMYTICMLYTYIDCSALTCPSLPVGDPALPNLF